MTDRFIVYRQNSTKKSLRLTEKRFPVTEIRLAQGIKIHMIGIDIAKRAEIIDALKYSEVILTQTLKYFIVHVLDFFFQGNAGLHEMIKILTKPPMDDFLEVADIGIVDVKIAGRIFRKPYTLIR